MVVRHSVQELVEAPAQASVLIVAKVLVMAAVEMRAPATVGKLVGLAAKINLIK